MTDVLCLCSDPVRRRSVIDTFRMGSSAFHGLLSRRLAHGSQSRFQIPSSVSCSQFDGFRFLPHQAHFGRSGISNRLCSGTGSQEDGSESAGLCGRVEAAAGVLVIRFELNLPGVVSE